MEMMDAYSSFNVEDRRGPNFFSYFRGASS